MNFVSLGQRILQTFDCTGCSLCFALRIPYTDSNIRFAKLFSILAFAFVALCYSEHASAEKQYAEYDVKGAYLRQLGRFIRWPFEASQRNDAPFSICIVGASPFSEEFVAAMKTKKVNKRQIDIRKINIVDGLKDNCQIAYISRSERPNFSNILSLFDTRPVLTVSDIDSFARRGGMIELYTMGNQIKLVINLSAARRQKINISSDLLSLAHVLDR